MKFFVKILMTLIVLCTLLFGALLINGIMHLRDIRYQSKMQEPIKTAEQNMNDLMNIGVCIGCDLGYKKNDYEQIRDLRQAVQAAKSKGLKIDLSHSNLSAVNLSGADLSGANLSGADLS